MPTGGALCPHTELAYRQGDLVRHDNDVLGRYLIKLYRLRHGLAGQVHKGLRLHEHDAFPAYLAGPRERLKAGAVYHRALRLCHGVARHEARVVACHLILYAGVAEKHDKPAYAARTLEKHGSTSLEK